MVLYGLVFMQMQIDAVPDYDIYFFCMRCEVLEA